MFLDKRSGRVLRSIAGFWLTEVQMAGGKIWKLTTNGQPIANDPLGE